MEENTWTFTQQDAKCAQDRNAWWSSDTTMSTPRSVTCTGNVTPAKLLVDGSTHEFNCEPKFADPQNAAHWKNPDECLTDYNARKNSTKHTGQITRTKDANGNLKFTANMECLDGYQVKIDNNVKIGATGESVTCKTGDTKWTTTTGGKTFICDPLPTINANKESEWSGSKCYKGYIHMRGQADAYEVKEDGKKREDRNGKFEFSVEARCKDGYNTSAVSGNGNFITIKCNEINNGKWYIAGGAERFACGCAVSSLSIVQNSLKSNATSVATDKIAEVSEEPYYATCGNVTDVAFYCNNKNGSAVWTHNCPTKALCKVPTVPQVKSPQSLPPVFDEDANFTFPCANGNKQFIVICLKNVTDGLYFWTDPNTKKTVVNDVCKGSASAVGSVLLAALLLITSAVQAKMI